MTADFSKVYLFLAQQGDWKDKADSLGVRDGVVNKYEFTLLMEEFDWDGENSTKSDLINRFWKSIDTKTTGKNNISGKTDCNTLNRNEIAAVESKIQAYQILDKFFNENVNIPSDTISNTTGWKNSVLAGLSARVEDFLSKNNKKSDGLEDMLAEALPQIEAKATADYCANEYLASTDIVAKLKNLTDYAYGSDKVLQGLINSYVKGVGADTPADAIKQDIEELINAYLATAGLSDTANPELLTQYGYKIDKSTKLNDLQKSVLKAHLTEVLEGLKKENDYEKNQKYYDLAINLFIKNLLDEALYTDFDKIKDYDISQFKSSKEGRDLNNLIQTYEMFESDKFYDALGQVNKALSNKLKNAYKTEFPKFAEIQDEIVLKVLAGDFDKAENEVDMDAVIKYAVDKIVNSISDFYDGDIDSLNLSDLNGIINTLVVNADKNQDVSALRDAAKKYCSALDKKGGKYAEYVKTIFTEKYSDAIDKMSSNDIKNKINELQKKVTALGDPADLKVPTSGTVTKADGTTYKIEEGTDCGITTNRSTAKGQTITLGRLKPVFYGADDKPINITSDRITYEASNSYVKIDTSGNVTACVPTADDVTTTIAVKVDGVTVHNIEIKISSKEDAKCGKNFEALYNNAGCGAISVFRRNPAEAQTLAYTNVINIINSIKTACMADGADEQALKIAEEKTAQLYWHGIMGSSTIGNGCADTNYIQFEGETYTTVSNGAYRQETAFNMNYALTSNGAANQLGIQLNNSHAGKDAIQFMLNTKCLMDIFNKFYIAALTQL